MLYSVFILYNNVTLITCQYMLDTHTECTYICTRCFQWRRILHSVCGFKCLKTRRPFYGRFSGYIPMTDITRVLYHYCRAVISKRVDRGYKYHTTRSHAVRHRSSQYRAYIISGSLGPVANHKLQYNIILITIYGGSSCDELGGYKTC